MDTGEHFKNNADYESQISAIFGHMRTRQDPLIMALNQRVLGSSPSASTTLTSYAFAKRHGRLPVRRLALFLRSEIKQQHAGQAAMIGRQIAA